MLKLYPSESGFLWGDIPVTKYDSGCLRSIAWKANNRDIRGSIPLDMIKVGAVMENDHARYLESINVKFEREVPFKIEVIDGVQLSGRMDFKLSTSIHETKGSFGKNNLNNVIKKGQYNVSYLAQLVGYMIETESEVGKLISGQYKFNPVGIFDGTEYEYVTKREFNVTIDQVGGINVDNKQTPYSVSELLLHRQVSAQVVKDQKVWKSRPYKWDTKWESPCTFCKFKTLCDKFDKNQVSERDSFVQAREILQSKEQV